MNHLSVKGKTYTLPMYLPDATRAVVKSLSSIDLINASVEGVVVNTYHLKSQPGIEILRRTGGVKNFMNFPGLVTSDSGGWQVFSLIHRSKKPGSITDAGVVFSIDNHKEIFTPEMSIQTQFEIGSDIAVCLDDFTDPLAPAEKVKESVERTILWAKRSKEEYNRIIEYKNLTDDQKPLLLAVIQGGWDRDLRKYCAEKLIEIGFDGYGFGGYVVRDGALDLGISEFIADLIPDNALKFALGCGKPYEIVKLRQMGWDIFDCTLPTRDARHKRLYNFSKRPQSLNDLEDAQTYGYIYISREKYKNDFGPISEFCDCYTCKNHTRAYLNHLFGIEDGLAYRLASIHNLRHYTLITDYLKQFPPEV